MISITLIAVTAGIILLTILLLSEKVPKNEKEGVIHIRLMKFLQEAHNNYILSYEKKNVEYFSKFCTPPFCERMLEQFYKEDTQLFGTKAYRKINWDLFEINSDTGDLVILKDMVFKNIRINNIDIPIADDNSEYWYLSRNDNSKYVVTDIIRC